MLAIELTEREAAMLRGMLEVQLRDLRHEIHDADDRAIRDVQTEKAAVIVHLLAQLRQGPAASVAG